MSFYAFRLLSPQVQLYWVIQHGTYLATRWQQAGGVNLYHCADEGRGLCCYRLRETRSTNQ